VFDRESLMPN